MNNNSFTSRYAVWIVLTVLVLLNLFSTGTHYRYDLTAEKRFTLSAATKKLLKQVDDPVQVDLFLSGDLKAGVKKLANSTQELLDEFNEYSNGRISYAVVDPLKQGSDSANALFLDSLQRMGILPKTQVVQSKKGEQSQRIVVPGAIIRYKNKIFPLDLLKGVQTGKEGDPEESLYANAETLLEYKFAFGIDKVTQKKAPLVGYVLGNGEPQDYRIFQLIQNMRLNYEFSVVPLDSVPFVPETVNALIVVKPKSKFSDPEKLKLDQYVMRGGNIIWMVDALYAEMDSLQLDKQTVAYDRGLGLEDLFFKYGIRINQDLVEDMQCARINLVVDNSGGKPQMQAVPWPYFPLLTGSLTHPISKNMDPVLSKFANSIDTVKANGIRKTVLLQSSANARTVGTPALISLESTKQASDPKYFTKQNIPVAVLAEGKFSSLFANRIAQNAADSLSTLYHRPFLPSAEKESRIIVCSDADIVMNEVSRQGPTTMGYSKDLEYTFANQDFIQNCFEYLVNPANILDTRSKDFTLRLLDTVKVDEERSTWQFINVGLPVLLVILAAFIFQAIRKRKYQG